MQLKAFLVCNMRGREEAVMPGKCEAAAKAVKENNAYDMLKREILSLALKPGEKLSENALAVRLKKGRVQIREALSQLAEEGYVVVYPQRGTEVTLISMQRIRQAVHAHIVLEQGVIQELCGGKLDEDQCSRLEEVVKNGSRLKTDDDITGFLASEWSFHYLLSQFGGHEHIWDVFRTLDSDVFRVDWLSYQTFNYPSSYSMTGMERTQVECRMLLNNIRRGDAEAAVLICANHFNTVAGNADLLRGIYPQYFMD